MHTRANQMPRLQSVLSPELCAPLPRWVAPLARGINYYHACYADKQSCKGLPAGQTSSGFSCTYWMACRVRMVSSTLRPKARLLMVACWMTPCMCSQQ